MDVFLSLLRKKVYRMNAFQTEWMLLAEDYKEIWYSFIAWILCSQLDMQENTTIDLFTETFQESSIKLPSNFHLSSQLFTKEGLSLTGKLF